MQTITIAKVNQIRTSALEELIVKFYEIGFEFYKLTGHDLLQHPDKQNILLATDRYAILVSEGKKDLADTEENLKRLLRTLERQASVSSALCRRDALLNARSRCEHILEKTAKGVQFRHLPLGELSRQGLNFNI
jgi:hypothetical protein